MKILIVSKILTRSGAPLALLNLLNHLAERGNNHSWELLTRRRGAPMIDAFRRHCDKIHYAENHGLSIVQRGWDKLKSKLGFKKISVSRQDYDLVLFNSVASLAYTSLADQTAKWILYQHEYETFTAMFGPELPEVKDRIDHFIVVCEPQKEMLIKQYGVPQDKITVAYPLATARDIRAKPTEDKLIIGASGSIQYIKGHDLFISIARNLFKKRPDINVELMWVGRVEPLDQILIQKDLEKLGLEDRVNFIGEQANPDTHYELLDVALLTSREEAFSLFAYEIGLSSRPIIYFDQTGGTADFLNRAGLQPVDYLDIDGMVNRIEYYYDHREAIKADGEQVKKAYSSISKADIIHKFAQVIGSDE